MLSRGILCYQIHQRELVDNLKLRERQVEIEEINDRIKAEEQRLDGLDVNNLIRERDVLEREMEKLIAEVVFDLFCCDNNGDGNDSNVKLLQYCCCHLPNNFGSCQIFHSLCARRCPLFLGGSRPPLSTWFLDPT